MLASLRPYATAGVALVGAGVIAATPIAPAPQIEARVATVDVNLAGASVLNIPANMFNALLSIPGASIADMARFSTAMQNSGSWHESSAGNVWGWDKENPEMLKGFIGMVMPFPALSHPLGEHLNWWAAANLPMHEGCAYECPEIAGMLNSMFRVPPWAFWDEDGYTFGEVISPYDGVPTEWSGQTVKLDPWEPVKSVIDYLMADPVAPTFPTMYEVITAVANLASSLQTTGHLPDWIAVREIETFFKLFFPAPVEETEAPESELMSVANSARTFTLDASALRTSPDDLSVTSGAEAALTDSADALGATGNGVESGDAPDPVEVPEVTPADVPSTPVEAVVDADTPEDAGTEPVVPTESTTVDTDEGYQPLEDDKDDTDDSKEPVGKHRAGGFDLAGTVKSVQDKFDSAVTKTTDSVTKDASADTGDADKGDKPDKGGSEGGDSE